MNIKLTEREKKLIVLLMIVGVVFLSFQYLIIPQMNLHQKISKENESLTLAYNIAKNDRGITDNIEKDFAKSEQKLNALLNIKVSPRLTDEGLDKYFTDLSLKHGLRPQVLLIEYSKQTKEETSEVPYKFIKIAFVTVTVAGNYDNLINMISEIDGKEYLSIVSMNSENANGTLEHSLKIQVIMLAGD